MSKKRKSPESSNDEQTNEASDSVFQQEPAAKRAKLASFTDTTLQDLPIELLLCILVKAVAMEVKSMKLAKSVWKEKADLVINRLRTVCSQWSSIFTTKFFRNQVHRILDVQQTIRLEILQQSWIPSGVLNVTTIKDEIFMLYKQNDQNYVINVYDRNNIMVGVKDVIPLPGINPKELAGCSVSNSVYTQSMGWQNVRQSMKWQCGSVLRITKEGEHQFNVSPWIRRLRLPCPSISVTANGSLIILSVPLEISCPALVCIYNGNASLQHQIVLPTEICFLVSRERIIQRSNGNLVMVSADDDLNTKVTEIDVTGRIIRQYQSPLSEFSRVKFADVHGRILICNSSNRMELLDSEFNRLDFTGPPLAQNQFDISNACYNCERNEIVGISQNGVLTICRFTEK